MSNIEGGRRRRGGGFSFGHIVGDPFALATISIAILAWLISLVASIIAVINVSGIIPPFAWWTIAYMFCCIMGIVVVKASNTQHIYQVAIVGFLSAGLIFTSSAVNSLVYSPRGDVEASAAGFILLSMVAIVWIFYFGSNDQASHRGYIDSFALHKEQPNPSIRNSRSLNGTVPTAYQGSRPETTIASNNAAPNLLSSAQLNGFETSSPVSGYPGGPAGASAPRFVGNSATSPVRTPITGAPPNGGIANDNLGGGGGPGDVGAPTEYPYRAKAIYSYEANPDDANEISFTKHEILEVSDVSGRWWQAKKESGETGIAPSNYLILL